ncbi:hypothetical protein PRIC1_004850 [Phytophthora ramorum]
MVNAVVETLFRVLASITSISVTLSMIPSMYRIYQKKDTGIASVLPLVCMVANAHVWMLDGAIVKNWFPMFATFLTSDIIAIIYTHPLRLDHDDPDALQLNVAGVQPLPDDSDVETKSKQTLRSPVYNMMHSPIADVSSRV